MASDQFMIDLALVEQRNQKWPRDVQDIRSLLGRKHLADRDKRHRIAAADVAQQFRQELRQAGGNRSMRLGWDEIKRRAKAFSEEWKDAHYEKGETQSFYNDFFEKIFGINRRQVAIYEQRVQAGAQCQAQQSPG